jgi:diguanylate cyclase (GGDEF)-like protein/PAS domain S-box-containing protein
MEPRRWWLLGGAVPVALACAAAVGNPALRPLGDAAVAVSGLGAAVVLWCAARSREEHRRSWRLLAVAPLLPVLGLLLAVLVHPPGPLQLVVLRWVPTVPGYLVAIVAILTLVDRDRLRAGGLRVGVEVALFLTACLVGVQLLVIGPDSRWSDLGLDEQFVLGAGVVATSATMAAALTLLGVIEVRRQSMALVLIGGAVLLTGGRGLGTSALLSGAAGAVDVSRFLVAGGLWLLALAPLVDPGGRSARAEAPAAGRSTDLGQLLPHVAMVVVVIVMGTATMFGHRPSAVTFAGAVVCVLLAAVHRWVSARDERRMAARLRRSEAYFRSLVRSSGDAVVILDDALRVSWASPALHRALGAAAGDLIGRPLLAAVHPEDVVAVAAALSGADAQDGTVQPEPARVPGAGLLLLRLPDADGVWRYLEAGVSDLRRHADVGAVVLHCRDMTERHDREQALQSVAYTDPMTGLPNRAGLLQALSGALSVPGDAPGTLLMIELDELATAREHAGREVVRLVVAEVGRRLRGTVRGEDVVARMGGGAFAVLACGEDEDADRLAARCLSVVERPIPTPAGIIELTAGVGFVTLEHGLGVETMLSRADLAVRAAHAAGRGSASRYTPALGSAAARRDALRAALQGAGARGELSLLFQPVVSLQGQRITGAEALLRWRHPTLGEVPPAEFLPLAERAGLIGELQRWALAEATSAAAALPDGDAPLRIGLNATAGYVATGALVADVEAALRHSGLAPERLVLEISAATVESDDDRIGLDMAALRFMGVHVALDDFGSGSSALSHLTRLPIDVVKLDRALISRIDRDPQMRALCESVVGIGRALNMDVVAEGVETPAQLAALRGFGCVSAQGFLLSRPVSLAALTTMLGDGAGVLGPGLVSRV